MREIKTKLLPILAIAIFILSGCAKSEKAGETYTAYYPECREPILEMQSQGSAATGAIKGGVGGGLLGGVTGFFVGLIANGGNVADAGISAAIGAATGAITGGVSGGVAASHGMGTARENQLLAKYYSEIDGDISGLDLRQAAGTVALQCYQKKFRQLEEMEKSGQITQQAASSRQIEIENGMREARQLIGPERGAATPATVEPAGGAPAPAP